MDQLKILKGLYHGRNQGSKVYSNDTLNNAEQDLVKALHEEGIVVVKDYFNSWQTEMLRMNLEKNLELQDEQVWHAIQQGVKLPENKCGMLQADGTRIWADAHLSDQRINHFELANEMAAQFAHDESFRKVGSAYLQRDITLRFCMANRTRYRAENSGSGGGWHRDMNYKKGFKALVYLTDVDENNGCFQYLPKSSSALHHLLKTTVADKYQFTHDEVMQMVGHDERRIMNLTGKAGTVVLFDTNGVHRGRPIVAGTRFALTNYYHD